MFGFFEPNFYAKKFARFCPSKTPQKLHFCLNFPNFFSKILVLKFYFHQKNRFSLGSNFDHHVCQTAVAATFVSKDSVECSDLDDGPIFCLQRSAHFAHFYKCVFADIKNANLKNWQDLPHKLMLTFPFLFFTFSFALFSRILNYIKLIQRMDERNDSPDTRLHGRNSKILNSCRTSYKRKTACACVDINTALLVKW